MITDEDGVRPVADREDDVEEYEEVSKKITPNLRKPLLVKCAEV